MQISEAGVADIAGHKMRTHMQAPSALWSTVLAPHCFRRTPCLCRCNQRPRSNSRRQCEYEVRATLNLSIPTSRTAGDRAIDGVSAANAKSKYMKNAWTEVIFAMGERIQEQKEACIRNLPKMLGVFVYTMEDEDLDFTMCKDSMKIVAQIAAEHFLITISPSPSFAY